MRLLKINEDGSFDFESFDDEESAPPYAILSHTWSQNANDEIKYQDMRDGTYINKSGVEKLLFCSEKAKRDGLSYIWIDSCNIKQHNQAELSEAIHSMFRWYQKSAKCYVFLSDVLTKEDDDEALCRWESAFRRSRWFTRGWTLQELLAPTCVKFYSRSGRLLGDKKDLEDAISTITGIPVTALQGQPLNEFTVEERFSWARSRQTLKEEDKAYCLIGIFGVVLPLIYGIQGHKAQEWLRRAIRESEHDSHRTQSTQPTVFKLDDADISSLDVQTPSHTIPFRRNANFLGRKAILKQLEQTLFITKDTQAMALSGPIGIGKTQTVLEFAYRVKERWREFSIFWLPATSLTSWEQACCEIAHVLDISPRSNDNQNQDAKEHVKVYLSSPLAGKWLLIVDKADDEEVLFNQSQTKKNLINLVPSSNVGLIVYTTRSRLIARALVGRHVIGLEDMDNRETSSIREDCIRWQSRGSGSSSSAIRHASTKQRPPSTTSLSTLSKPQKLLSSSKLLSKLTSRINKADSAKERSPLIALELQVWPSTSPISHRLLELAKSKDDRDVKPEDLNSILSQGESFESADEKDRRTPLICAIVNGKKNLAQAFLDAGASTNTRDEVLDWTPTIWAIMSNKPAILELLISRSADLAASDSKVGWTPLLWAASVGNLQCVQLLLTANRSLINVVDKQDKTPHDLANAGGHLRTLQYLAANTGDVGA